MNKRDFNRELLVCRALVQSWGDTIPLLYVSPSYLGDYALLDGYTASQLGYAPIVGSVLI